MKQKLYCLKTAISGIFGISMIFIAVSFHVFVSLVLP